MRKGLIGSQYGNGHDETAVGLGLLAAVLPESEGSYKRLRRSPPPISRAGQSGHSKKGTPTDAQVQRAWNTSCILRLRYHCSCWMSGTTGGA